MSIDSSGSLAAIAAELRAAQPVNGPQQVSDNLARWPATPPVATTPSITTKPGVKTSEFPVALIGQLIGGVLVATGRVTQGEVDTIATVAPQVIGGLVSLGSTIAYIWSRTRTKQAAAGIRR